MDFLAVGERGCDLDSAKKLKFSRERGGYMKQSDIKENLIEQLEQKNMNLPAYLSLVDDYMKYWKLKDDLQKDIKKNGVRFKQVNGNGIAVEKFNESINQLPKITAIMIKILADLGLKEPVARSSDDDYL